jgi:hypothetical protein
MKRENDLLPDMNFFLDRDLSVRVWIVQQLMASLFRLESIFDLKIRVIQSTHV